MKVLEKLIVLMALTCVSAVAQLPDPDFPEITSSWVNSGESQRSMIQSIGVKFDRNVAGLVTKDALKLKNLDTGTMVDLSSTTLRFDPRNNSANWVIDYSVAALLPDGNYMAWIDVDYLVGERDRAACALTATPLDDYVFFFHQYCGDSDGDRDVDFKDSCVLRETWLESFDSRRFKSFLDFDLSAQVDSSDRDAVNSTYFSVLEPVPAIHLYLRNDTGDSFLDNVTSLYGMEFSSIACDTADQWVASIDGGAPFDITDAVSGGQGVLSEDAIDLIFGGDLTEGQHNLRIEAKAGAESLAVAVLDFEYVAEMQCPPYFITTPPTGIALGKVREAQPLNMSDWVVESYPGSQTLPDWQVAEDGLSVIQVRNARPSALISQESVLNLRITGTFRVDTASDDDLMGFIFGYQNSKQFYIFDWKQRRQGYVGGTALRGMSIKRIDAEGRDFTEPDFWWSDQNRENTTILSPPNDIPWENFQDYQITLEFTPGNILIEVYEEGVLLDRLEVADDSFTGGRFGFYNYSQQNVIYSGFTQETLDNVFFYDSEAEDPDGVDITYSLVDAADGTPPPAGATINADNGVVLWKPTEAGTYPMAIVATDSDGLTDRQDFDVLVSPIDLPPTVVIRKTASSVYPGEEVGIMAEGSDDQQLYRVRLFIDDVEVDPNTGQATISTQRTFSEPGVVTLRAIAVDSADQVTETVSYIRVLDPTAPPPANPDQGPTTPPGQGGGDTDLRPVVSFQAPLDPSDDASRFVGTVDPNGGTLANWYLEWALASRVDFSNLNASGVLWQVIGQGTGAMTAEELATIVPGDFPDEDLVFRIRAVNTNGLGSLAAIAFNPRSSSNTTSSQTTTTSGGTPVPVAEFTAPLGPTDDNSSIRATINANGGTLRNWTLDYAPRNSVDLNGLNDSSVAWTFLARGNTELNDGELASLATASLPDALLVFRLRVFNENGNGRVAGIVFNPTSDGFSGPDGTTGSSPADGARPVTAISSPRTASDDLHTLLGTVLGNGGSLDRYVVDYALLADVNTSNFSDPSVSWTELTTGNTEKNSEALADLTDAVFDTGVWVIRLRAFNDNGLGSLATTVLDSGDRSVPYAEFTSPDPQAEVTYLTDLFGTINGGDGVLASWVLDMAPGDEVNLRNLNASANWQEIASGTGTMDEEKLGTLDPTLLRNGSWILRLRAFNTNGRGFADGLMVFVDGEAKLGNFRMVFTELSLPLAGVPITIRRIYDSLDASHDGDFGPGWTMNLQEANITESIPDTGADLFSATPFEIGTRVYITSPTGERLGYTFNVRNRRNSFFYVTYEPYFVPDPGVRESLLIAPRNFERVEIDSEGAAYTIGLPFGYNPDYYVLETPEGGRYEYYQRGGLQKISDGPGSSVTFSRNAITHSDGTSITITRDRSGRITSITDPEGKSINYEYDSLGRLRYMVDRLGERTEFVYGVPGRPNYLTEVVDPRGVSAVRSEYGPDGRMIGQTDARGNSVGFSYDLDGRSQTVTDRLGNTAISEFDDKGNVTRIVDKEGGVSQFDYYADSGRQRFVTDALGTVSSHAYDSRGNLIVESIGTSVLENPASPSTGSITRIEFDGNSSPTRIIDANGNINSITYDPLTGDVKTFQQAAGAPATEFGYSAGGEINEITDGVGNVTTTTETRRGAAGFDDGGLAEVAVVERSELHSAGGTLLRKIDKLFDGSRRMLRRIDYRTLPGGGEEAVLTDYRYDDEGELILQISPNGMVTEHRYDAIGQLIEKLEWKNLTDQESGNDALARKMSYEYDLNGNLVRTVFPDGSETSASFDAENRMISETDAMGRVTRYEYDREGRPRFVIYPDSTPGDTADNPRMETRYDAIGQPVEMIDEIGNRTEMRYNSLGFEIERIRHLGSGDALVTEFDYDQLGNLVRTTSPKGSVSEITYDGQNRPIRFTNPSTTAHGVTDRNEVYDALGRRTTVRNEEGRGMKHTYSGLGRLTAVEYLDASGSVLTDGKVEYEYDEVGNKLAQIYASGNRTEFEYDQMGRRTARTLPGGQTERFTYDAYGQMITHTDFDGYTTEFEYDSVGRLVRVTADTSHPSLTLGHAPARIEYTHFADGLLKTAKLYNLSNAEIYAESYTYDDRGRLSQKAGTFGTLFYEYNPAGQVTQVRSDKANGLRVDYVYDQAGRIIRVVDATSGTTEYTYDDHGNVISVEFPNGVVTSSTHDARDLLLNLKIEDGSASLLENFDYERNPRGDISRETRADGRMRSFTYDDYYRLINETVSGGPAAHRGTIQYGLDAAGNRITRTSGMPSVNSQTLAYDANFRLVGTNYDANGNTLRSPLTAPAVQGNDVYDFRNKLIRRTRDDGLVVDYIFDAKGDRVSKVTSGSLASTSRYLIDTRSPTGYSQVVEERNAAGDVDKVYCYGHQRISQRVSGATISQFFGYDGGGNVIALFDASGGVLGRFTYDAFGILLEATGGILTEFLYRGEQFEHDLGLYYQRARFLNTNTGRFWTRDGFEGFDDSPLSLHHSLYADANPVTGSDPSGKFTITGLQAAMVISFNVRRVQANHITKATEILANKLLKSAAAYARHYLDFRGFASTTFLGNRYFAPVNRDLDLDRFEWLGTNMLYTQSLSFFAAALTSRAVSFVASFFKVGIKFKPKKIKFAIFKASSLARNLANFAFDRLVKNSLSAAARTAQDAFNQQLIVRLINFTKTIKDLMVTLKGTADKIAEYSPLVIMATDYYRLTGSLKPS